jgi:p-aminobenzoyl-glutamate transporter AbgT
MIEVMIFITHSFKVVYPRLECTKDAQDRKDEKNKKMVTYQEVKTVDVVHNKPF